MSNPTQPIVSIRRRISAALPNPARQIERDAMKREIIDKATEIIPDDSQRCLFWHKAAETQTADTIEIYMVAVVMTRDVEYCEVGGLTPIGALPHTHSDEEVLCGRHVDGEPSDKPEFHAFHRRAIRLGTGTCHCWERVS